MEKKTDSLLKRSYSSSAAVCKASLASVPVERSLRIWLSQLSRDIEQGVPIDQLLDSLTKMKYASGYLCDFSIDALKTSAKDMALANSAIRDLWIK